MKTCKWLMSQFTPRYPDRVFLFLLLFLVAAIAFTIEFQWSDKLHLLSTSIYAAVLFAFATFVGHQRWKSWTQWISIALFAIVNALLYLFLSMENYLDSDWYLNRRDVTRLQVLQFALAGSTLVFVLVKLIRLVVHSSLGKYLAERRVRILMLSTVILLGCYYVLLGFDLRFPEELELDHLTSYWFWLFLLPFFFALPMFLTSQIFSTWWKYALAMIVVLASIGALLIRAYDSFIGVWLVVFGSAYLVALAIILRSPQAKPPNSYRPNFISLTIFSAIILLSVTVPRYLDFASLIRSQDSNRWQYAYEVANLKSLRSAGIKFQMHKDAEYDWPNEWFEVEWNLDDGHEVLVADNLPYLLEGTLTIKNMRPDFDFKPFTTSSLRLIAKNGQLSMKQLASVVQPKVNSNASSITPGDQLDLVDVEFVNPTSFQFTHPVQIDFESNHSRFTSSILKSFSDAKFKGGSIIATINHNLTDRQWQRLSEMSEVRLNTNQYPLGPHYPFISINSMPDQTAISSDWFDNVPIETGKNGFFLWYRFPDANLERITKAQIRLVVDSQHKICILCGEGIIGDAVVPQSQHQLVWDLQFAANPKGRFGLTAIESKDFTASMIESDMKLAKDYHWFFSTNLELEPKLDTEKDNNALLLPYCDQQLLDYVCSTTQIDTLALTSNWASPGVRNVDDPTSYSVIGKLKSLKRLTLAYNHELKDISWTRHLNQLEYFEFHPDSDFDNSDLGFVGPCPNLKTVVIHRAEPIPFIEKLIDLPSTEKVVLILSEYGATEAEAYWTNHAEENENARKVEVLLDDRQEYPSPTFKAFQRHRSQVRQQVREKYLSK